MSPRTVCTDIIAHARTVIHAQERSCIKKNHPFCCASSPVFTELNELFEYY